MLQDWLPLPCSATLSGMEGACCLRPIVLHYSHHDERLHVRRPLCKDTSKGIIIQEDDSCIGRVISVRASTIL